MRFATDATLGKLGRHLRTAGFDTLCQHQNRCGDFFNTIDGQRIILTRTMAVRQKFKHRHLLFIRDNDPLRQMMQVVRELGVQPNDLRPFSRCIACNTAIAPLDRDEARGRVPDYVWQRHRAFHRCDSCRRIYWAGSHRQRMGKRLDAIFK
ncbi:hypothetical protein DSCA_10970 [Desulfosarcina alkanivorans]|uniref:Mut7-C RNAse domain-containing protein n=1 Tax=Desulfosarcina alkanivorans TaxID=571177 RepID=A0A5K7YRA3_9BACT|nr:Mut7-C RNAse domain-containing protein [Desulfosarcina alkanivorans]BBO67167.1 hypothetical protein DSCA_10970 [Desulfosarcina alkanivorans]